MQDLLNLIRQQGPDQLEQLLSFIHYSSRLKNEILLAQPPTLATHDTHTAPLDLPDGIEIFLAAGTLRGIEEDPLLAQGPRCFKDKAR
jgi:hypothetical protein